MAKYQLKQDVAGYYYWILKSRNGETVTKSSESYDSKQGAKTSIEWTRNNAKGADYEDLT